MIDWLLPVCIGLLTLLHAARLAIYLRGPWRSTRAGSVWVAMWAADVLVFGLLTVDQVWNVPDPVWLVLAPLVLIAAYRYLRLTIRAGRGPIS